MGQDFKFGCFLTTLGSLLLLALFGGCYVCSKVNYSDGYRDGIVEKCSKKGVIWKTDEGRMILGGMEFSGGDGGGNLTARVFNFTCASEDIAKQIEAAKPGQRIRVHYDQKIVSWNPNGETAYFVHKVEILKNEK